MKSFIDICKMTQPKLKTYLNTYLTSVGYNTTVGDGFVYAEGKIPVLLIAHMDTVHKEICKDIVEENGKISSPQGIGGDDRCGCFMIMNIVRELKCSVLFCEDEEIGGVGARKFVKSDVFDDVDVNYIIEFDRKGNNDAVFYNCDNKDFTSFVCDNTGLKEAYGSFSDISVIAPALCIAAVNMSCGYYNAHTTSEYVIIDEMMDIIEAAKALIKTESDKFEYIAKKINYPVTNHNSIERDFDYGQMDLFHDRFFQDIRNNELEIEVVWFDDFGVEHSGCGIGMTKAEAWFDFFVSYPEVSMSMVEDYSFQ